MRPAGPSTPRRPRRRGRSRPRARSPPPRPTRRAPSTSGAPGRRSASVMRRRRVALEPVGDLRRLPAPPRSPPPRSAGAAPRSALPPLRRGRRAPSPRRRTPGGPGRRGARPSRPLRLSRRTPRRPGSPPVTERPELVADEVDGGDEDDRDRLGDELPDTGLDEEVEHDEVGAEREARDDEEPQSLVDDVATLPRGTSRGGSRGSCSSPRRGTSRPPRARSGGRTR